MMKHSIKSRILLFIVLFFKQTYMYFDVLLDREWCRIVNKQSRNKKDSPAFLKNHF
jgi:hypothetical protein